MNETELTREDLTTVLKVLKSLSAKGRLHDSLYRFVVHLAEILGLDDCSVVRIWGAAGEGQLLASSADESAENLPVLLHEYPELKAALSKGETVVLEHEPTAPLSRPQERANSVERRRGGILVLPIVLHDVQVGSMLLRCVKVGGSFSARELSFCEVIGEAAASALERLQLLESLQTANERLERLAITDGLTGLYNYRYFQQRLQQEFHRAVRYKAPLACIMVDVDDFKRINDTLGHLQGDAVLRQVAARTLRSVRLSDIVARYGGEEIVAIMPQTDADGAAHQASRLRKAVADAPFEGLPAAMKVTVSIGVAVLDPATMVDPEDLVQAADQAMYAAKAAGKNRISVEGKT